LSAKKKKRGNEGAHPVEKGGAQPDGGKDCAL